MNIENLAALTSPVVRAITSKFPKFTRRASWNLVLAISVVISVVFGSVCLVANVLKPTSTEDVQATSNPRTQQRDITLSAREESPQVFVTFGDNNKGNPTIHNGNKIFPPPRYERVYQLESDGPDYPIFMSKTLAENNFVQGFANLKDVFTNAAPDPGDAWDRMIARQVKLDYNTEVVELPADLDREVGQVPNDRRFVAKLAAQSLAKVHVINGNHRGETGWVYRPLMRERRLPAVD